ncbi:ComF family protein [Kurthia sibirica]|uniref:Amidophosphoribosyltransferase n=1 Tax=Kurthia sibirica TaxID=202750 RepID=A0A2U3AMP6_9BACL|nr:phosphoribosyltransferase family protein [Kurthia sibirica]PWI25786.1 amidophosphoribosyltransferase [Kurthia sibirica]GEK35100.1 competence protein [Kurthia sibirica]
MKNCLLCDSKLKLTASWQQIIHGEKTKSICTNCRELFEKSQMPNSLYRYNEAMKKYLHQLKFLQDCRLTIVFAKELQQAIKRYEVDIIMPIPMHVKRLRQRTFAHVDELLKSANLPFEHLLEKTTTERQSDKNKQQRLQMENLFRLKPTVEIAGKRILIVDDLWTTGTTIQHATKILQQAQVKSVHYLTLIKG